MRYVILENVHPTRPAGAGRAPHRFCSPSGITTSPLLISCFILYQLTPWMRRAKERAMRGAYGFEAATHLWGSVLDPCILGNVPCRAFSALVLTSHYPLASRRRRLLRTSFFSWAQQIFVLVTRSSTAASNAAPEANCHSFNCPCAAWRAEELHNPGLHISRWQRRCMDRMGMTSLQDTTVRLQKKRRKMTMSGSPGEQHARCMSITQQ